MKKLLKAIAILLAAFCLFGCENPAKDDEKQDKKEIKKEILLKYNDWGTVFYSLLQSDGFKIPEVFTVEDSEDAGKVILSWKGKSNRDMKKLHILIADDDWNHQKTEEERRTPVATNIKKEEEFTIKFSIDRSFLDREDISIYFCCGIEDTDGPVHLYSSETEDTTQYDEYMNESGNAILNSPIKVVEKGEIKYNKTERIIHFTKMPIIKLPDGTTADGSTNTGKKSLLDNGYFTCTFDGDDFSYAFWRVISNKKLNVCAHGNWDPILDDFQDVDFSDALKKITNKTISCQCIYFARSDKEIPGTTPEEREEDGIILSCYSYFPVVAFDISEE